MKKKKDISKMEGVENTTHHFNLHSVLSNRNMLAISAIHFCSQWGFYFFIAWLPVYLQEGRHFSELEMKSASTIIFIAGGISVCFGGFGADWLVKKKGISFSRRMMGMLALGGGATGLLINSVFVDNTIAIAALAFSYFVWSLNGVAFFNLHRHWRELRGCCCRHHELLWPTGWIHAFIGFWKTRAGNQ